MVGKPACGNALTLLRAVNPAGPGAGWLFPCPCGTPWCARPCRGCPGGLAGSSPSGCCGSRRHRCREVGPGGDPAGWSVLSLFAASCCPLPSQPARRKAACTCPRVLPGTRGFGGLSSHLKRNHSHLPSQSCEEPWSLFPLPD